MKILHTSDWHLGHSLYNYDRTEEQMAMLQQMVDIVRAEHPDVFLLCGDVYHTAQPSSSVQTMFTNALVAIHEASPSMTIVITAGNHDSGAKHEIFRTPWRALNVHVIGNLDKSDFTPSQSNDPQPDNQLISEQSDIASISERTDNQHIIEISGKGFIVALPYANERNIPEGFFQHLLDVVASRNNSNLPVVMSAHTTVEGCDFTGHDHATEFSVGGIDTFRVDQLGDGYDYLALGHIHHEQFVHTGRHNVRYSGTPIPISFDENYEHSVSLVTIDLHGSKPEVKKITIKNPRPLVTLPTEGVASWNEAKALLSNFPADIPAYIRLNVEVEDFLPVESNAEAMELTKGKQCRFCHINTSRKNVAKAESKALSVQEFQTQEPVEIVRRYAEDKNITFDIEMEKLFNDVLAMVNEDMRNKE